MSIKHPFIYFCNRFPGDSGKLTIHTSQCPYLANEPDRVYIGIAPSPSDALRRAEKVFSPKLFILCPKCCREAEFES